MASGFFLGGLGEGVASGVDTVSRYKYTQGLLQLEQQRLQQSQQNQQRSEYMKLRSDLVSHIGETITQLKNAHPDWTDLQVASNPAVVGLKNSLSTFTKNLQLPDDSESIIAGFSAGKSQIETEAALARAKEGPLAAEEKKARIDYLRSGIPQGPGSQAGMLQNPDAPGLPGNDTALGTPATFGQRFAQTAPVTATDVGADVGEQAGEDYLKKNVDPTDANFVKSVANYDADPSTASARVPRGQLKSRRETVIEQAMAYAKAKGEDYNPRAFKVVQDFLGNGKHGDQVRSLNVITEHMATLRQLGDALNNKDIQAFNAIAQRWAQETGQSAPTNFQSAKDIVGTELIKALGVAGAGSADERQELQRRISLASSPKQINDAIDSVYGPLLSGQLKGLRNQYLSAGGPREKFDKFLLPATREYLEGDKKKKDQGEKKKDQGEKKKDQGITVHGFTFTPSDQ